ncbi:MAG: hypothetical protein IT529_17475 [Burkholderiales bacterium]|nr:hypothetical protein [Burkholderiales bacterium]
MPAQAERGVAKEACGEVIAVATHGGTTTRYAFGDPGGGAPRFERIALVPLPGGGGHLDLDDRGCARKLTGNSLVRSMPHFRDAGFATALLDAPSDHPGEEGLAGFRTASAHAEDLGKVIADVRGRVRGAVWVIGTSRGAISAVNAASRLAGAGLPDGVVLTSALMEGSPRGRLPWTAQSVFDLPLESIRVPVLVVGHAADGCVRSPPDRMERIVARTSGEREQVVTVTGGPGGGPSGLEACAGRTPHGFHGQEEEVAAGIARFIRGGRY